MFSVTDRETEKCRVSRNRKSNKKASKVPVCIYSKTWEGRQKKDEHRAPDPDSSAPQNKAIT
jgi:hypothetical protein